MAKLLRNLGPKTMQMLATAGITSIEQLRALGPVPAYLQVKQHAPTASLNLLYAIGGAVDDIDWRQMRRKRKHELLLELDAASTRLQQKPARLRDLRNIGPAIERKLAMIGITEVRQLVRSDPDRLYDRLQEKLGQRVDPCVWDVFAAAIHQARTGEALPWSHFSATRKARNKVHTRGH